MLGSLEGSVPGNHKSHFVAEQGEEREELAFESLRSCRWILLRSRLFLLFVRWLRVVHNSPLILASLSPLIANAKMSTHLYQHRGVYREDSERCHC